MNTYFKMNDTVYDVTTAYPEAIELLAKAGLDNLKNENMRKTLGKTISLEQALKMKKISTETFEENLVEAIKANRTRIDAALTEKEKKENATITLQGVLPCPVRVPLLEGFEKWLDGQEELKSELDYTLQAASMGVDWIKDAIKDSSSEDILSDIFISAGFDLFFDQEKMGKFKEAGVFADMSPYQHYNSIFENDEISLKDPAGQYSMLAVVPAVFLVNQEELNGRKAPESWEDILAPEYENSVSLPIGDFDLFNSILLNISKKYGTEGVEKLGKSLLKSMHPSEMVKSHTKKFNRPAVTIMPYFFTKMTKAGGPMTAVWPKDGAIISPIFMLTKASAADKIKPLIEFFTSKGVAEILSHQGLFPSVNPEIDNRIPKENPFMWVGWDYINSHNIGQKLKELEDIFAEAAKQED
ncbi:MAG: ABC transporter substrate-binding protein [Lachnospiraceae bacterium]